MEPALNVTSVVLFHVDFISRQSCKRLVIWTVLPSTENISVPSGIRPTLPRLLKSYNARNEF